MKYIIIIIMRMLQHKSSMFSQRLDSNRQQTSSHHQQQCERLRLWCTSNLFLNVFIASADAFDSDCDSADALSPQLNISVYDSDNEISHGEDTHAMMIRLSSAGSYIIRWDWEMEVETRSLANWLHNSRENREVQPPTTDVAMLRDGIRNGVVRWGHYTHPPAQSTK